MEKRIISTSKAPKALGPYSQAVVVDEKWMYISGQIPVNPATGELVGGDIKAQTKQVMENILGILTEVDRDMGSLIKTTIFVKDLNNFDKVNEVYAGYFDAAPPTRACVEVARLPKDVGVEIEAIAVL